VRGVFPLSQVAKLSDNFPQMNRLAISALILSSSVFFGCSQPTRKIVGEYSLERFQENGMYYLITPEDLPGGGVFDGTVQEIGWNNKWILARVTRLYHGDTNGWYALNLMTKQVVGPIQESELRTNSAFSSIECYNSAEVFSGQKSPGVHK
jgi:hypothetical protein